MLDMPMTIAGIVAAIALLAVSIWQTERPRKDSLRPRWIPWRFLIFVAAAFILYLGVHAYMLWQAG